MVTGNRAATTPAVMPPNRRPAGLLQRPGTWLVVVATLYAATMVVLVAPQVRLGWDEAVYASQVSPRVPAALFTAPRARGITYLIAPVVWMTGSVPVLHAYLAILSGVLLVVAYWPWLRIVRRPAVVPVAAVVFAGLWVVLFYGASAMPNPWVAYGAVFAAGWFVRYGQGGERRALAGVAGGLAFTALMRPGDAFWLAIPLTAAVLLVRRWRRWTLLGSGAAGLAVGAAPWVAEAYTRFGGPLERLYRARQVEGGIGWHPRAVTLQMHSLYGPMLCRPCHAQLASPWLAAWWVALPLLAAGGLMVAVHERRLWVVAVPAMCGASIAFPYLFTLTYAAPRFLIPAYALLSLPIAEFTCWLPGAIPRLRKPAVALLALALVAQVAFQVRVLGYEVDTHTFATDGVARASAALSGLGLRPPCILTGRGAVRFAYYTGCRVEEPLGPNSSITRTLLVAQAHHEPAAHITTHAKPPSYAESWEAHRLPVPPKKVQWTAFIPPWEKVP